MGINEVLEVNPWKNYMQLGKARCADGIVTVGPPEPFIDPAGLWSVSVPLMPANIAVPGFRA